MPLSIAEKIVLSCCVHTSHAWQRTSTKALAGDSNGIVEISAITHQWAKAGAQFVENDNSSGSLCDVGVHLAKSIEESLEGVLKASKGVKKPR